MTDIIVPAGTTRTTPVQLASNDTLTIQALGILNVTTGPFSVNVTGLSTILNQGQLLNGFAGGNAVAVNGNVSITNEGGAIIRADGDAFVSNGTASFSLFNLGEVTSLSAEAFDFTGATTGATISNAGSIGGGAGFAIRFGDAADVLEIRAGSTILGTASGGGGLDTVSFEFYDQAVTANLNAGTGAVATTGFERVVGTAFADTLTAERASGGNGNDTLEGGILSGDQGNDRLVASLANYDVMGGAGNDTVVIMPGSGTSDGGAGIDTLDLSNLAPINGRLVPIYNGSGIQFEYDWFIGGGQHYNFENLIATDGNEEINPVSGQPYDQANIFRGRGGNDFIEGRGGNDSLYGDNDNDTLFGGDGDDSLVGGAGSDLLHGEKGNDTLDGGDGSDIAVYIHGYIPVNGFDASGVVGGAGTVVTNGSGTDTVSSIEVFRVAGNGLLIGSAGRDVIGGLANADTLIGGAGSDQLDGGKGTDTLRYNYAAATQGIALNVSGLAGGAGTVNDGLGGTDTVANFELVHIVGSAFNDTITGGSLNDLIEAASGNDRVILVATAGVSASGGEGIDTLDLSQIAGLSGSYDLSAAQFTAGGGTFSGFESIVASGGDEALTGTADANFLYGNAGNDTVSGGAANDTIDGGGGNDVLAGGSENDFVTGSGGNDSIAAGTGDDFARGDAGDDTLYGGDGNDTLRGADGNDVANGDDGGDLLLGVAGDDTLSGGLGNDTLDGGAGADTAAYDLAAAGAGVTLNAALFFSNGNGTVQDGLGFTDALTGIEQLLFTGSAFADSAIGGGSRDVFLGNAGDDTLNGNGGLDTLSGGDGNDSLLGGGGEDSALGGAGNDTIYGEAGNDTLDGGWDADRLYGGDGVDTLAGGIGDDVLDGGAGNDGLAGDDGNDTLAGGTGNDSLAGGSGNDALTGGDGNDTLNGGAGNDTLTGGASADRYLFQTADSGADTIFGFNAAEGDRLNLSGSAFTAATESAGNTTLTHTGGTIVVRGVTGLNLAQWNGLTAEPFTPETATLHPHTDYFL